MLLILLAGGILMTFGDVIMKRWLLTENWHYGACGMLAWILGLVCLAATLKSQNIAIATITIVFFNVGTLALVEWLFFHNPLTPQQIAGLSLGLVAVILLETAS